MEGISDIKIIGIDEKRPPIIRNEPYIDLFFKLSHKAPLDWCQEFNSMVSKLPGTPKVKLPEGIYIEAWVKTPDLIIECLELLKSKVAECSELYIHRIEQSARDTKTDDTSHADVDSPQGRLNQIIASLVFDKLSDK